MFSRANLLLLAGLLAACQQGEPDSEDTSALRGYTLAAQACNQLELSGHLQVTLQADPAMPATLTLRGPPDALAAAELNASGQTLQLHAPQPVQAIANCGCPAQLRAVGAVNVADHLNQACATTQLSAYGDSQVQLHGISGIALEVRSAGRSQVLLAQVDVDRAMLYSNGQSRISIEGTASEVSLQANGQSKLHAGGLRGQRVTVVGRGQSEVQANATAHLTLDVDPQVQFVQLGQAPATVSPDGSGARQ